MIITIIVVIILFFIIKTVMSSEKDKQVLRETPIDKKFKVILDFLNSELFNNKAKVTKIDWQSFYFLEEGSNQMMTFIYSHQVLSIEWKYKYFQKEIKYERTISNAHNLSLFEQQKIAEELLIKIYEVAKNHQIEVTNI